MTRCGEGLTSALGSSGTLNMLPFLPVDRKPACNQACAEFMPVLDSAFGWKKTIYIGRHHHSSLCEPRSSPGVRQRSHSACMTADVAETHPAASSRYTGQPSGATCIMTCLYGLHSTVEVAMGPTARASSSWYGVRCHVEHATQYSCVSLLHPCKAGLDGRARRQGWTAGVGGRAALQAKDGRA